MLRLKRSYSANPYYPHYGTRMRETHVIPIMGVDLRGSKHYTIAPVVPVHHNLNLDLGLSLELQIESLLPK